MSAVKKTSIRIKNMDDPAIKKASQNKKSSFDFDEDFDIEKDMRHRLANTDPENRIDLNDEQDLKKKKTSISLDKKVDLSGASGKEPSEVTARMYDRFNSILGRNDNEDPEEEDAEEVEDQPKKKIKNKKEKTKEIFEEDDCEDEDKPCVIDEASKQEKHKISLRLYRNIAGFFIIGTLILLSAVFYFTAVKLTIDIIPKKELVSDNLPFEVVDQSQEAALTTINSISGAVEAVDVEKTKKYSATGVKVIGEDAVGKITLYNNYIKNQPLVATTRLMTPDGQLFRLKDTVNVPVGGSVEAEVYADKPSADINVPPTKFTIPGLWAGIQDKIYGESKDTIKYQQQVEKYVQTSDIELAESDIKSALNQEAADKINTQYKNYKQVLFKIDDNSITKNTSVKVGDKADEFDMTIKAAVGVVAFNDENVLKIAKEKLLTNLPVNKELVDFNDKFVYNLDSISFVNKTASVSAGFSGMTLIKGDANVIDKNKIVDLNEDQLRSYLSNIKEISDYSLTFYPSWLKKVPKLVDRITVNIKK